MTDNNGYLTTHVLDTARGCPAEGIKITLYRLKAGAGGGGAGGDGAREKIASALTNDDGRTDAPILPKEAFATGYYELVFATGDYLRENAMVGADSGPLFLDDIPIRFGIDDPDAHYHVPLLLSPFGYSTYRGS